MADVKWITIVTDVFDDEKIRYIETLPEGNAMIVIWFKLICLAGKSNRNGFLMITNKIPYTEEMLVSVFNCKITLLKVTLQLFEDLEMIEIVDNKIYLKNFEKYQNIEGLNKIREQARLRQAKRRKLLEASKEEDECHVTVTLPSRSSSYSYSISNSNIDSLDNKNTSIDSINNNNTNIPKNKEEFIKYGEYGWIKLKPSQYDKLKTDYPNIDIDNQIKLLDEYVQSNGNKNKYKDFNLVIRKSIKGGWFTKANNAYGKKAKSVPDWFDSYVETEDKRQEELQKEQEKNVMTMEEMEAIFAKKKIEKAKVA